MPTIDAEGLIALQNFKSASERVTSAIERIGKHIDSEPAKEPAWPIRLDLQNASRDLRDAEQTLIDLKLWPADGGVA